MKHNQSNRRQRSRGNNRRFPNQRGGSFESSGPEVKVRGTAQQVLEKYQALARDAYSAGDRILCEGYLQHAEHYYRILNADNDQQDQGRRQGQRRRDDIERESDMASEGGEQTADSAADDGAQRGNGSRRGRGRRQGGGDDAPAENGGGETGADETRAADDAGASGDDQQRPRKPRGRPRKSEQPAADLDQPPAAD